MKKLVNSYRNRIQDKKYVFLLLTLFNFMLTPVHFLFFSSFNALVVVINFSLVILAGIGICHKYSNNAIYYIAAFISLMVIWLEFTMPGKEWLRIVRQLTSLVLFVFLCYLLVKDLIRSKAFDLQSILGALSGFLFFGLIGGVLFEFIDTIIPGSFLYNGPKSGYIYYYFSFISITTVGYGDVTPITPQAQSITIIMNVIGQFYLTIVVALFVGKYLNKK